MSDTKIVVIGDNDITDTLKANLSELDVAKDGVIIHPSITELPIIHHEVFPFHLTDTLMSAAMPRKVRRRIEQLDAEGVKCDFARL